MDYPKSVPGVGLVGGKFVDENQGTGQVGSLIPSAWGNAVTDELLAVLAFAGIAPSEADSGQLLAALQAKYQLKDATLTALAALATVADKLIYATGVDTFATATLTAFARTLLDDADAATARATLGAQASDATLTALAGVMTAADKLIYATGVDTFATATLTAFARTLLDDADAATALATLGAQPLDATLTALAAQVVAADKLIYATGVDTFATATLTAFARTLLDDVDAATARATLGAQGLDATLTALSGLAVAADKLIYATAADTFSTATLTAFARTLLDDVDAATARATLGAQASDATLTALAGVVTAADKLIYATGVDTFSTATLTAFARTLLDDATAATARTTLGAVSADEIIGGTQTLQDVRASRVGGTTYTNSTGRPIVVYLGANLHNSSTYTYTVNGVVFTWSHSGATTGIADAACFIVPAGGTYAANVVPTIWLELR